MSQQGGRWHCPEERSLRQITSSVPEREASDLFICMETGRGCGIPGVDRAFGVTRGSPLLLTPGPKARTLAEDRHPSRGSCPLSNTHFLTCRMETPNTLHWGPCGRVWRQKVVSGKRQPSLSLGGGMGRVQGEGGLKRSGTARQAFQFC